MMYIFLPKANYRGIYESQYKNSVTITFISNNSSYQTHETLQPVNPHFGKKIPIV